MPLHDHAERVADQEQRRRRPRRAAGRRSRRRRSPSIRFARRLRAGPGRAPSPWVRPRPMTLPAGPARPLPTGRRPGRRGRSRPTWPRAPRARWPWSRRRRRPPGSRSSGPGGSRVAEGTSPATPVVTGTSSRRPVASAKNVSPSVSPWAGRTARARPSWADMASRRHSDLAERGVGGDDADRGVERHRRPQDRVGGGDLGPGRPAEVPELPAEPARSTGEHPRHRVVHATGGVERHQRRDADAVGQHRAGRADPALYPPATAPVPAPTHPWRTAPARPQPPPRTERRVGPALEPPARARSNSTAAGTMGTTWWGCSPTTKPTWRWASQAMPRRRRRGRRRSRRRGTPRGRAARGWTDRAGRSRGCPVHHLARRRSPPSPAAGAAPSCRSASRGPGAGGGRP